MPDSSEKSVNIFPRLKRDHVATMLEHLSHSVGARLELDEYDTIAFSYYDNGDATLVFLESSGLLILAAPVADPAAIELPRLRELLEFNMDWRRPCAIIVPDNDSRAHLAAILPVDPDDPSSLEKWLVKAVSLAGETSCAANVIDVLSTETPAPFELA